MPLGVLPGYFQAALTKGEIPILNVNSTTQQAWGLDEMKEERGER
jgi:hypothetical protein